MKREGHITFFRRIFFVSQFRKFLLITLRCFRKLLAANIFYGYKVGYHVCPSNFFSFTLPKTFIGNSSPLQIIYGSEKIVLMREGYMTFFFVEKFLNHSTGNFYWEFLGVSEIFWYGKKHMMKMGVSQISAKHFLSHNTKKVHWKLFGVSKNFW